MNSVGQNLSFVYELMIDIYLVIGMNNQNVFKKYTGIFAMTISGILSYTIYSKGGMDSNRLIEFLNKFLLEQKSKLIILEDLKIFNHVFN